MEFNVADLIERVAKHIPDREAVICGDKRATYQHFNDKSEQFARYLLSVGINKDDHVGIYAYNSIEWIEAMIACYKIGAVPININYRYVDEELIYLFKDADLKALVFDVEFSEKVNSVKDQTPLITQFVYFNNDKNASDYPEVAGSVEFEEACKCEAKVTFPERSADDHYVLYTGGTTGMPKGVVWRQGDAIMIFGGGIDMHSQEPIESPEAMADRCLSETHFAMRSLNMAPLMHGAAQWIVLRALFEGGTTVLLSKKYFDPHEVWQKVETEGVNVVMITGDAMGKPLLDAFNEGNVADNPNSKNTGDAYDPSSILAFVSTSAIFSPSLKDKYADTIPNAVISDNIGSSESGFTGTSMHEKGKAETNAGGPRVTPAKNVVVLDENFEAIPAGDERVGLFAKSGYIPLEYYKDPKKSAKTFITAADGNRYVIPGDMARHNEDGTITMLGRDSVCINTGGEKVFAEEVEMAVKAHDSVFDCLVAPTPHERFGSAVTALIQLAKGVSEPSMDDIHKACQTHIARYKLPKRIYYVDQIKRAPSGKADYKWAQETANALFAAEN